MQKSVSYVSQGIRGYSDSLPRSDVMFKTESKKERLNKGKGRQKLVPI